MKRLRRGDYLTKRQINSLRADVFERNVMARHVLESEREIDRSVRDKKLKDFCNLNGIKYAASFDSFYFSDKHGNEFRISNHTMTESNKHCFNCYGEKVRETYHQGNRAEYVEIIVPNRYYLTDVYMTVTTRGHKGILSRCQRLHKKQFSWVVREGETIEN